jgi:hypothetical protein
MDDKKDREISFLCEKTKTRYHNHQSQIRACEASAIIVDRKTLAACDNYLISSSEKEDAQSPVQKRGSTIRSLQKKTVKRYVCAQGS